MRAVFRTLGGRLGLSSMPFVVKKLNSCLKGVNFNFGYARCSLIGGRLLQCTGSRGRMCFMATRKLSTGPSNVRLGTISREGFKIHCCCTCGGGGGIVAPLGGRRGLLRSYVGVPCARGRVGCLTVVSLAVKGYDCRRFVAGVGGLWLSV